MKGRGRLGGRRPLQKGKGREIQSSLNILNCTQVYTFLADSHRVGSMIQGDPITINLMLPGVEKKKKE